MNSVEGFREKFVLVAPSWVIPGGIVENSMFLADKVDEVSLCFFELNSSLAYTEKDIPQSLALLPLSWQVHLPFDLPDKAEMAFENCLELLKKISFLRPKACVLHPFKGEGGVSELRCFLQLWQNLDFSVFIKPELWIENTEENDLIELFDLICEFDLGICFDLGHAVAYNQTELIRLITTEKHLTNRVRQVHISVIDKNIHASRHLELPSVNDVKWKNELAFFKPLLKKLAQGTRLQPEIFNWKKYINSVNRLNKYFD
ncbi:cobamide remodeling phosphodiesterase CbiR [Desulfovibrio litoralis]|uniref:Xylose isomerase-like TIM barrel n=1 Tax=Desulfovibrio litoralis DSM 11393 TaxID=1121455 RepID=A0A1M7SCE9_9BACT|nr:cobamide remodeling phosphodiesterase CbiR [Desulfovibrio litoralis]SHN56171.1 hypothetical protein SAMN02745728_00758 [Desulfovibrio litoralis DSM 11393]